MTENRWDEELRSRTSRGPDQLAYIFLRHGGDARIAEQTMTYAELDARARAIGALLQSRAAPGSRVLLLYPPGLEYIAAFYACLYSGFIAVPAFAPERGRAQRTLPRLRAIAQDAEASLALTLTRCVHEQDFDAAQEFLRTTPLLTTDDVSDGAASDWREPKRREDIALLQYTSGSTTTPRGVVLTHANMLANAALGRKGWRLGPDSVGVSWLPLYHDLGVLTVLLHPVVVGFPTITMDPAEFVQQPIRWLEALSRYGGTFAGGPNFAFDLCVRRTTEEQRASLDLRRWRCAFNGAEPVRHDTLERFATAFAPAGFRRDAMYPCYGLAEANFVTGGVAVAPPVVRHFDKHHLERGEAVRSAPEDPDAHPLVGCGRVQSSQVVIVVEPATMTPLPANRVGEILIAGASVARGYFRRDEEDDRPFGVRVPGRDDSFFRTGDLGFFDHDELFVTGRLKDLIIVRGVNHYPQDIERTVERAHPRMRPGCGAAFGASVDGEERLVVVQEIEGDARGDEEQALLAVRRAVVLHHELGPHAVVFVRAGTIPKTTSGKIQRSACRMAYSQGLLEVVAQWLAPAAHDGEDAHGRPPASGTRPTRPAPSSATSVAGLESWLVSALATRLGVPPAAIDVHHSFAAHGLDSRAAVELSADLSAWLGRDVSPTVAYAYPTVASLARYLASTSSTVVDFVRPLAGPPAREPIAIVGIGCRLPRAPNPQAFWQLLREGIDAIGEVPVSRWSDRDFYHPDPSKPGKTNSRWGGFLDEIDRFDPLFFGISPREARHMDPQQRLLLEVAWEALEDAGEIPAALRGSATGVFVGITTDDYGRMQWRRRREIDAYTATGSLLCMAANRISYVFDLRGPSMAIDTACSSSLVAVHAACESLWTGKCTLALAGGVNVILAPENSVSLSKLGALAADGRCKTFDASADGFVRGEGAAVVVLKPVSRALAAGDRIYAVIRGGAVNQDGRSNGITAPNPLAQEAVLREAYASAGVSAHDVQYVEAHGTGTPLGDAMELRALSSILKSGRGPEGSCAVGSVKTNIGHLESAAGIAGLLKVALALHHEALPPSLHFRHASADIDLNALALRVPTALEPWRRQERPRRAGVSSFGIGGTNAHLVLEEAPRSVRQEAIDASEPLLLALSATSRNALDAMVRAYASHLSQHPETARDACFTACVRRTHHAHRLAFVAESPRELVEQLAAVASAAGTERALSTSGAVTSPRVAFVFSGHGSQWRDMGREGATHSAFRDAVRRCDAALRPHLGWSIERALLEPPPSEEFEVMSAAQPLLFAIQVALVALWRSWGVEPDAVVGHSIGEVAAAHAAGALDLENAARLVAARSAVLSRVPGRMAVVGRSSEDAERLVAQSRRVSIAAVNGPSSTVLSGDADALEAIRSTLEDAGEFFRWVNVRSAAHSPLVEPHLDAFRARLGDLQPADTQGIAYYSATRGRFERGGALDASYWADNLRSPVRFDRALDRLLADGFRVFVEISPRPVSSAVIQEALGARRMSGLVAASQRDDQPLAVTMRRAFAALYMSGKAVDFAPLHASGGRTVSLPSYAWQRERHWLDDEDAEAPPGGAHPLLTRRIEPADPASPMLAELDVQPRSHRFIEQHAIDGHCVFNSLAYVEMLLAALSNGPAVPTWTVRDVVFARALLVPEHGTRTLQLQVSVRDARGARRFVVHSRPKDGSGPWEQHVHGNIEEGTPEPQAFLHEPERASILARCKERVRGETFYGALAELGMQFGPQFRGLSVIHRGDGEALGEILVPPTLEEELEDYFFHPALLDACAEVLVASRRELRPFMPVRLGRVTVHGKPTRRLWSHARSVLRRTDSRDFFAGDIEVFDDCGRRVASIHDVELQLLDAPTLEKPDEEGVSYEVKWRAAEAGRILSAAPTEPLATWVAFTDRSGVGDALAQLWESRGDRVVLVACGDRYAEKAPDRFEMVPGEWDHLAEIFRTLARRGSAIRGVVHLLALDGPSPEALDFAALDAAHERGVVTVAGLVQQLAALRAPPRLWLVTRGAVRVQGVPPSPAADQAPLWGLGRTLSVEQPHSWGGLLDLDPAESDARSAAAVVARWIDGSRDEPELAQRAGVSYVPRLVRSCLPVASSPLRWRTDASYIVAGGLGGVGLRAARWMVGQGARWLILLGRSPLPPRSDWSTPEAGAAAERIRAIQELEAMGAHVLPAAVDIANEAELRAVKEQASRQGWPGVRGIIQAAADGHRAAIAEVGRHELDRDHRPKVLGTWLLGRVFDEPPLDFFVLYSSTAALFPSPFLGAYAAANAFMDAFAEVRRAEGKTALSIDWGMFSEVGLSARLEREHGSAWRAGSLTPEEAMSIQSALMAAPHVTRAIATRTDWSEYARAYPHVARRPIFREVIGTAAEPVAVRTRRDELHRSELLDLPVADRHARVIRYLVALVADLLAIPASRLTTSEPLANFGMDSLVATKVSAQVTADLNVAVPLLSLLRRLTLDDFASRILDSLSSPSPATVTPDVDPAADVRLDESVTTRATATEIRRPEHVLVTGVTGFVGSFLLAALVASTHVRIRCLVRAPDAARGWERVRQALRTHGLWDESVRERVVVVTGDLAEPLLGMSPSSFEAMAEEVDAVYHAGAVVNFLATYSELRAPNVLGTREIVHLAFHRRLKALHFVSSVSAFFGPAHVGATVVESEEPRAPLPSYGYAQTKWASDRIVALARTRCLPCAIYRPGFVGWHSRTGAYNPADFITRLLQGCLEIGLAPSLDMVVSMAPVDYVTRAIVHLAGRPESIGKNFHLVHPAPTPWDHVADRLERMGLARRTEYAAWRAALERASSTSASLRLLLPFFPADMAFVRVMAEQGVTFDSANVREGLECSGLVCPPLDETLLSAFVGAHEARHPRNVRGPRATGT